MMKPDEAQIIIACQQGDLTKFAQLYDQYIKKIYNFVYYKTNHPQTAEDLVSQTFIKALENITKFKLGSQSSFSAWLYRIAQNTVIDYYRTKKADANINDYYDLASTEDTQLNAITSEQKAKVQTYLQKLNPEQRQIVIMRLWDELSYQEIASLTQKSEASCRMTFCRAIGQLKKELLIIIAFITLLIK
ncbi:MAG: RNA polymerase sigma factor [Patescibacteria group bacterium]